MAGPGDPENLGPVPGELRDAIPVQGVTEAVSPYVVPEGRGAEDTLKDLAGNEGADQAVGAETERRPLTDTERIIGNIDAQDAAFKVEEARPSDKQISLGAVSISVRGKDGRRVLFFRSPGAETQTEGEKDTVDVLYGVDSKRGPIKVKGPLAAAIAARALPSDYGGDTFKLSRRNFDAMVRDADKTRDRWKKQGFPEGDESPLEQVQPGSQLERWKSSFDRSLDEARQRHQAEQIKKAVEPEAAAHVAMRTEQLHIPVGAK